MFFQLLTMLEVLFLFVIVIVCLIGMLNPSISDTMLIIAFAFGSSCLFVKLAYELFRESRKGEYRVLDAIDLEMSDLPKDRKERKKFSSIDSS